MDTKQCGVIDLGALVGLKSCCFFQSPKDIFTFSGSQMDYSCYFAAYQRTHLSQNANFIHPFNVKIGQNILCSGC